MNEYIPCLSFWVCVTSLSMIFLLVPSICLKISWHFFSLWVVFHCVNVSHFLFPSFVWGTSGCLQVLAIMKNAVRNTVEQMFSFYECPSFGYMPKSGIAGSWGRLTPNFLRNCHTDFQSGLQVCTPTRNEGMFSLLHILSSISYHRCFWS